MVCVITFNQRKNYQEDIMQDKLKLQKLTVDNVGKWVKYNLNKHEDDFEHMAEAVGIFFNTTYDHALSIDIRELSMGYNAAMKQLAKVKDLEEPLGEVVIDGVKFTFNKDLTKLKAGQVIDIKKMGEGLIDRPAYLLAVLYDGGDMSRKDKEELFKTKFPVDEFLSVLAFFLQVSNGLSNLILRLAEIRQKEISYLTGMYGQMQSSPWRRTLIGMWMWLRECIIQLFYFGKSFSWKKRR